jgi:hypothetical protein
LPDPVTGYGPESRSASAAGEGLPVLIAIALDPGAENVAEARHRIVHVLANESRSGPGSPPDRTGRPRHG